MWGAELWSAYRIRRSAHRIGRGGGAGGPRAAECGHDGGGGRGGGLCIEIFGLAKAVAPGTTVSHGSGGAGGLGGVGAGFDAPAGATGTEADYM
jgi:hypothetical protein